MESPSPHRSSCSTGYATPDPQRTSPNEAQLFVGTRALTPLSSQPSHTTALVSLPSLQRRSCLHAASSESLVSLNERKLVALSASALRSSPAASTHVTRVVLTHTSLRSMHQLAH